MKSPVDTVKGKITDYNPETGEMTVKVTYPDWMTATRRQYKECLVQMIDSRSLSDKQRKSCYAMIHEIADYTGMGVEETKQWMKIRFLTEELQETADQIFSLSNASMSLVCAFQAFLVDLIISWEIPTRFPLIDMVDDVQRYVYSCAVHKKCCICGKPAIVHHWKRIGMGADREHMNHIGIPMEPLCWEHHTECHNMVQKEFDEKYHIEPVKIDKMIARVFNLSKGPDKKQIGFLEGVEAC